MTLGSCAAFCQCRVAALHSPPLPCALAGASSCGRRQAASEALHALRAEGWSPGGSWALAQGTARAWALGARQQAVPSRPPAEHDG